MSTPTDHARAYVRQHAEFADALGVEFVPKKPLEVPADAADTTGASADSPPGDATARLEAIRERYIADAPHAPFNDSFTNIVFGEGDPDADLMFIGEAPGADEDASGRPFVGRAGQLLDKMIVAMGLARERVYIANVLKVRPPGNATPTTDEAEASEPYLLAQILAVRPRAIVTLGLPATRLILQTSDSMGRMRGRWFEVDIGAPTRIGLDVRAILDLMGDAAQGLPQESFAVPVMPTYHPAYLLRSYTPENRQKVWSDLQQVMERLGVQGA